MTDFEKDPTDDEREEFSEIESIGEAEAEEYSGLLDRLSGEEQLMMLSTARMEGDNKSVICLTNQRVILFNSDKSRLLGKRNRFEDARLEDILDIEVEERKGFDILTFETEEKERKLMAPEGKGVKIAGLIREQQDAQKHDPAKQLERIGKEKERGNITEEEYEAKKDELMDRI